MRKALWGAAVATVALLAEGAYAQFRIGEGSGEHLKIHTVNEIWLGVILSTIFIFIGVLSIWGARKAWRWRILPAKNVETQALTTTYGVPYKLYRPAWLTQSHEYSRTSRTKPLVAFSAFSTVLGVALVVFSLFGVLGLQLSPAYEVLKLSDGGELRSVKAYLFPNAEKLSSMNLDDVGFIAYSASQQRIAVINMDGSQLLIFEDFTITEEIALGIASKLERPLEQVARIN